MRYCNWVVVVRRRRGCRTFTSFCSEKLTPRMKTCRGSVSCRSSICHKVLILPFSTIYDQSPRKECHYCRRGLLRFFRLIMESRNFEIIDALTESRRRKIVDPIATRRWQVLLNAVHLSGCPAALIALIRPEGDPLCHGRIHFHGLPPPIGQLRRPGSELDFLIRVLQRGEFET